MKIKQNETKQIMCNVCKRVKNATLIHAKTSFTKRRRGLNITKVDTFTLQYRLDHINEELNYVWVRIKFNPKPMTV